MIHEPGEISCLYGAEALLKRLKALEQEIDGVCVSEDIECIHRMRVASRRLRSALNLFGECFPEKNLERWKKQVRNITRTLGSARDLDVQIDFLHKFKNNLTEQRYRPGINRLLLRSQQRRTKMQTAITRVMSQLKKDNTLKDLEEASQMILSLARLHNIDNRSPQIYQHAYLAISMRLEKLLAYRLYVSQPERVTELHEMRISAKRLRYAMEIFAALYHDELEPALKAVREIQTMLGDIHDCVVWITYLPEFLEKEKARTFKYFGNNRSFNRLKAGILYLQQDRQQYQAERYKEFFNFWQQIEYQCIWENLPGQILQSYNTSINSIQYKEEQDENSTNR